jgi:protein TonB
MRVPTLIMIVLVSWTIDAIGQVPCEDGMMVSFNEEGNSTISFVEKAPYLKEGLEPYVKWIENNMNKKLMTKKRAEKKKVFVGFVVNENGSTSDFRIVKGIGDPYDKEAMRLIMENPGVWIAGECGKRKVRMSMVVPVKF